MTTKQAIERHQIPTWKEWMEQARQREQARQDRNAAIGYRAPMDHGADA